MIPAFNHFSHPVSFEFFAHDKGVERMFRLKRRVGDGSGKGIGSKGEATNRDSIVKMLLDQFEESAPDQNTALRDQAHPLHVDIKIRLTTGSQGDLFLLKCFF